MNGVDTFTEVLRWFVWLALLWAALLVVALSLVSSNRRGVPGVDLPAGPAKPPAVLIHDHDRERCEHRP